MGIRFKQFCAGNNIWSVVVLTGYCQLLCTYKGTGIVVVRYRIVTEHIFLYYV